MSKSITLYTKLDAHNIDNNNMSEQTNDNVMVEDPLSSLAAMEEGTIRMPLPPRTDYGGTDEPDNERTCRICLQEEDDDDDPLMAPCRCKGSQQWVHRTCLDEWRATHPDGLAFSKCNECQADYHMIYTGDQHHHRSYWCHVARDVTLGCTSLHLMVWAMGWMIWWWLASTTISTTTTTTDHAYYSMAGITVHPGLEYVMACYVTGFLLVLIGLGVYGLVLLIQNSCSIAQTMASFEETADRGTTTATDHAQAIHSTTASTTTTGPSSPMSHAPMDRSSTMYNHNANPYPVQENSPTMTRIRHHRQQRRRQHRQHDPSTTTTSGCCCCSDRHAPRGSSYYHHGYYCYDPYCCYYSADCCRLGGEGGSDTCCCCDCGDGDCCVSTSGNDCDCGGGGDSSGGGSLEGPLVVFLLVVAVVLAAIGLVVGVFLACLWMQRILQRHLFRLYKQRLVQDYVVQDLSSNSNHNNPVKGVPVTTELPPPLAASGLPPPMPPPSDTATSGDEMEHAHYLKKLGLMED